MLFFIATAPEYTCPVLHGTFRSRKPIPTIDRASQANSPINKLYYQPRHSNRDNNPRRNVTSQTKLRLLDPLPLIYLHHYLAGRAEIWVLRNLVSAPGLPRFAGHYHTSGSVGVYPGCVESAASEEPELRRAIATNAHIMFVCTSRVMFALVPRSLGRRLEV